jgi:hypothetical protein
MNVYNSDFDWPEGTKIAALRILQLLPKTTAPPNQPRIGVAEQTNARAVLGTAPVEPDGSAHFTVPAGRPIYFQALDERGLAVQSMRSVTYLQPGETLACQGCHEPQNRAPRQLGNWETGKLGRRETGSDTPTAGLSDGRVSQLPNFLISELPNFPISQLPGFPLALRRPPSALQPPPDGANPFSYVRLVQPVLDRHCVSCHQERKALDLTGGIEGGSGWTRSYQNLAGKYGFYFHVSNGAINTGVHGGSRTVPGGFGARSAPLLKYLDEGHYGVQLPPEDFHRITLWLDCNSEFFGAYENTAAQSRGEVVYPSLY